MTPDPDPTSENLASARDLGAKQRAKIYPPNVKGWAVIVGISRYSHAPWNLEFAHRDAEKLSEIVSAPEGGRFENVQLLINENATYRNVTKALRSFLKQPDREDIVLLYFACHGTPDPDRPDNVYLLTHDTDPQDISGTALPMREIDLAIRETLRAERVVILADTCHSGGIAIGAGGRRGIDQSAIVNKYLKDLSQAKGGVALLTSAAANETSREGKQWGEGHGVFTHFLLEGMHGQADGYGGQPRDGKVGVRELFEYVRDMVKKETGDGQHPVIGPDAFDPGLPMAISGEVDAKEHCSLASGLEHLAALLDEPMRYRAAAVHYAEAVQFAGKTESMFAEAELGLGRSLIRAGELDQAARVLRQLIEREKENAPAHAYLELGVTQAMQHLINDAAATLTEFVQRAPQDEAAPWATRYISWLTAKRRGMRYAVLIGINEYRSNTVPSLKGCVNDVHLMREVLAKRYGVTEDNIVTLLDATATRQCILSTFAEIGAKITPADQVLVFYSGHSVPQSGPDAFGLAVREGLYLVVHDTRDQDGYLDNGISADELHRAIRALPAQHKVLVLDTHLSNKFNSLAESDGDYAVLLACDSAQITEETQVEIEGQRQTAGLFTAALVAQLSTGDPQSVSCGELLAGAVAYISEQKRKQTPLLIGDKALPFFGVEDVFLNGFDFAHHRSYAGVSPRTIASRYSRFSMQFDFPFPELYYSLGLAFSEKGLYEQASTALKTALAQKVGRYPEALLTLAAAQMGTGSYGDLLQTLNKLRDYASESQTMRVVTACDWVERLASGRRYALLVGISKYSAPGIPTAKRAVHDALAMRKMLVDKLGFAQENVSVLLDGEATREAILTRLKALADKAMTEPALFFFAGNGSYHLPTKQGVDGFGLIPTLLSGDSRRNGVIDLGLDELSEICSRSANLVTVLDSWGSARTGSNRMEAMAGIIPATRGVVRPKIGGLTVYAKHSFPLMSSWTEIKAAQGKLTNSLIRGMDSVKAKRPTYQSWLEAAKEHMGSIEPFEIEGSLLREPIFESVTLRAETLRQIRLMNQAPLDDLIQSLQRLINQREQQRDTYPRGRLNLGIAYAVTGDLKQAADALDRAVALYSDPSIMSQEHIRDPLADEWFQESRHHLGRVLYESKRDLGRAVNELEKVVEKSPDNGKALYYYGQAIRAMVERETLGKAQEVLECYLEKGAPLGHEDEVREFLGSRAKAPEVLR